MATYKKPQISVYVRTLQEHTTTGGDGATFEALKAHKTVEIKNGNTQTMIPFHAVTQYIKGVTSDDTEKADPYCAISEEGGN